MITPLEWSGTLISVSSYRATRETWSTWLMIPQRWISIVSLKVISLCQPFKRYRLRVCSFLDANEQPGRQRRCIRRKPPPQNYFVVDLNFFCPPLRQLCGHRFVVDTEPGISYWYSEIIKVGTISHNVSDSVSLNHEWSAISISKQQANFSTSFIQSLSTFDYLRCTIRY